MKAPYCVPYNRVHIGPGTWLQLEMSSNSLSPVDRQLVLRIRYVPGEAFPSYNDRLADRYQVTLPQLLIRVGLSSGCLDPLTGYGVLLSEQACERFAFVTGLTPDQVEDMLITRYSGTVLGDFALKPLQLGDCIRHYARNEWAYFKGSHLCPLCLRETAGVWLSKWKLPWSFACTRHGILLHHTCPGCGDRPRAGRRRGSRPFSLDSVPQPLHCSNPRFRQVVGSTRAARMCGHSFVSLATFAAPPAALTAQESIDQKLQEADSHVADSSIRQYFEELRSVCALVLFAFEIGDFGHLDSPLREAVDEHVRHRNELLQQRRDMPAHRRPQLRTYISGAPTSSFLMAAVVPSALPIVESASQSEIEESVRILAERLRTHSRKGIILDYVRLPSRIRGPLNRLLGLRSDFNYLFGARSANAMREGQLNYESKHIPQLMPEADFASFRRFFVGLPEVSARLFCSMSAVKLLGFSWPDARRALDLAPNAEHVAHDMVSRLRRAGLYNGLGAAPRNAATRLSHSSERIDYKLRRDALRSMYDIPPSAWRRICKRAGVPLSNGRGRTRYVAAWIWADATSGYWRMSPAASPAYGRLRTNSSFWAMMGKLLPNTEAVLRAHGEERIERFARSRMAREL